MRTWVLLGLSLISACKREAPPPADSPPGAPAASNHRNREGLELARPSTVTVSSFDVQKGIEGSAKDFDAVAEFMRGLKNVVWCSRGWARVVERSRNGVLRAELQGSEVVVDIPVSDAEFPFEDVELVSSELLPSRTEVAFKLRLSAL